MADWLLEFYSEEIPAGMQAGARLNLKRLISDGLAARDFNFGTIQTFVTPRRLVAIVTKLDAQSPDRAITRKGPRLGAPEAALNGFLKSCNLTSLDELTLVRDDKKGDYYQFTVHSPGQPVSEGLKALQTEILMTFPWPKRMRWGTGSLRWVRPLRSTLSLLETSAGRHIIPFEHDTIKSQAFTHGHAAMMPEPFEVQSIATFESALCERYVMLETEKREKVIKEQAQSLAAKAGVDVVDDPGLLREVAGLVEWPVVLSGCFDEVFLALPDEVIRASIKVHQKCFVTRDKVTGALTNTFIIVANKQTVDAGATIIRGNERVVRARLDDAVFFWEDDRKTPLDDIIKKLESVLFHAKLGSVAARVKRLEALIACLAESLNLNADDKIYSARAAHLCKADLVTGMVGEFPELQGLMGSYYAAHQGEPHQVAQAIRDHYRPQGPADRLPEGPVSEALALAEKFDLLAGFWSIDEKPSGSRDPFALRRAALGILRIVEVSQLRIDAKALLIQTFKGLGCDAPEALKHTHDLLGFMVERLRTELRERGLRHDIVEAILASPNAYDFYDLINRTLILSAWVLDHTNHQALMAIKRVNNMLKANESKIKRLISPLSHENQLSQPEEKALWAALSLKLTFEKGALNSLTQPINHFFEAVRINDPEEDIRERRLGLLAKVRAELMPLADFGQLIIHESEAKD